MGVAKAGLVPLLIVAQPGGRTFFCFCAPLFKKFVVNRRSVGPVRNRYGRCHKVY